MLETSTSRIVLDQAGEKVRIIIRPGASRGGPIFMILLAVGIAGFFAMILNECSTASGHTVDFWILLCLGIASSLFFLLIGFWSLWGRFDILIGTEEVIVCRKLFGVKRVRSFPRHEVNNLVMRTFATPGLVYYGIGFNFRGKAVNITPGLTLDEAERLLAGPLAFLKGGEITIEPTLASGDAGSLAAQSMISSRTPNGEPTPEGGWCLRYPSSTKIFVWVGVAFFALFLSGPWLPIPSKPMTPNELLSYSALFGSMMSICLWVALCLQDKLVIHPWGIEFVRLWWRKPLLMRWEEISSLKYYASDSIYQGLLAIQSQKGPKCRFNAMFMNGMPRLRNELQKHVPELLAPVLKTPGFIEVVLTLEEAMHDSQDQGPQF